MSTAEFNNQFVSESLFDELFPITTESTDTDVAEFIVDVTDNK